MRLGDFMLEIENAMENGVSVDSEFVMLNSDGTVSADFAIASVYANKNKKNVVFIMDEKSLTSFQMKMLEMGARMDGE